MKQSIFILLLTTLSLSIVQAQSSSAVTKATENFILHFDLGYVPYGGTGRLMRHFKDNGFDDDLNGCYFFCSSPKYPKRRGIPFFLDLGMEYRLRPNTLIGLTIGADNKTTVRGYDGLSPSQGHFATRSHSSFFISPQYRRVLKDGKWSFAGGPALNFQAYRQYQYSLDIPKVKKTSLGAILSLSYRKGERVSYYAAFRWMPKIHFSEQIEIDQGSTFTRTSTLPAADISFSYLRLGVRFGFE